jgi:hypothetical protein
VRRRTGFTTIELLTAISILVILAGMAFIGFRVIGGGGKTRSTKAALDSGRSMMAEIDASGGLANIKSIYQGSGQVAPLGAYPAAFPTGTTVPTPVPAPQGNVSEDAYSSANTVRYTSDAVVLTQQVMKNLLSAPTNRTILGQLPGDRLFKWRGTAVPPTGGINIVQDPATKQWTVNPAMLVDAWGNPIIYVPPAGLGPITVGGNTNRVQTSVGIQNVGYTPVVPGASGFWASAGPDGDFRTGDDNVYSFE